MESPWYDRQGNRITVQQFEAVLEKEGKVLGKTQVGEQEVSTVWLGLNHGWDQEGELLIFETMIFGYGPFQDIPYRYSTEQQAYEGHKTWVQRLKRAQQEVENFTDLHVVALQNQVADAALKHLPALTAPEVIEIVEDTLQKLVFLQAEKLATGTVTRFCPEPQQGNIYTSQDPHQIGWVLHRIPNPKNGKPWRMTASIEEKPHYDRGYTWETITQSYPTYFPLQRADFPHD